MAGIFGWRNSLLLCFFSCLVCQISGLTKEELFPYGQVEGEEHDQFITTDAQVGDNFALTVPIVLYGKKYTTVYVNTRGIVTFGATEVGSPEGRPFPPPFAAIAPFYADIAFETENVGVISFRESTRQDLLDKANAYIHQAFPDQGAFLTQSVVIVTWDDVVGHGNPVEYKNSLQLVVANGGDDSFALFLYPSGAMVWGQTVARTEGQPPVFAQAGFASDDGKSQALEGSGTDYIRNLPQLSTPEGLPQGVHVYHIGNPTVESETASPVDQPHGGEDENTNRFEGEDEQTHPVTREPIDDRHPLAILTAQRVAGQQQEHGTEEETVPVPDEPAPEQPDQAYPSPIGSAATGGVQQQGDPTCNGQSQCHASALCNPKNGGSCCECAQDYYGNGKLCFDKETAQRMTGQVSGQINGINFQDALLHNYIVISEGRMYVAFSPIPDTIGGSLQIVFPVASAVGWLFATPESGLKNGLQLTGGVFNQTATVRFTDSGQSVHVSQRFSGLDEHQMLHSVLYVTGTAPTVADGQTIEIADHQIEYRRSSPGNIQSFSKHSVKVGEQTIPYTVEEAFTFQECPYNLDDPLLAKPAKLHISRVVSLYQKAEKASRFGMDGKLTELGAGEPDVCLTANCGPHTGCVSQEGRAVCFCSAGYEARDANAQPLVCTDVDECVVRNECSPNAECINGEGSFVCSCLSGYVGDGRQCKTAEELEAGDCAVRPEICDINAHCQRDSGGQSSCVCHTGFTGDGRSCQQGGSQEEPVVAPPGSCFHNPTQCDRNAACVPIDENSGRTDVPPKTVFLCQCLEGFEGNGLTCRVKPNTRGGFIAFTQGMSVVKLVVDRSSLDRGGQLAIVVGQTAVGITVDCVDSYLYWSDIAESTINRAHYDGTDVEAFVRNIPSAEGLAIDPISRNIFWTDSTNDYIAVAKLTDIKAGHKVLISKNLQNPRAIAVHPSRGTMYWSDWNRKAPKIETASMDGTDRRVLVETGITLPNALAVDYQADDLCWADAGNQKVECISLEGTNRRLIHIGASYPFSMTVHENRLYWTDWGLNNIMSVSKSGADARPHELPVGSSGKVYGITSVPDQCPRLTNACAAGNGGCRFICLPMPGGRQQCVCPETITADQCVQ